MGRVGSVLVCVLVLVTLAVALAPRSAALTVTYNVSSESLARGTSTGFASEAYDDGATNTKTEGGTATSGRLAWLKPNGDNSTNAWNVGGVEGGCLPTAEWCRIDESPVNDGNTTYIHCGVVLCDSNHDAANWAASPATLTSVDSVTVFIYAKQNASVETLDLAFRAVDHWPLDSCIGTLAILTRAFANYSITYTTDCDGSTWTVADVNSIVTTVNTGAVGTGNKVVTSVGTVVSYTTTTDYYLDFTSTFLGVTGSHQALVYKCTTTDEASTLDAQIGGASVGTATCDGGLNRLDLSTVAGSIAVRLVNSPTTGDTTASTFAFDVLTLVSLVEEGPGGAPRADFTSSYVWWENRVFLRDASTRTVGNITFYGWADMTGGVPIESDQANVSFSPYGPLDMSVHEIVVEHTVVDEFGGRSTVQKTVRIDNTPRFLVLATIIAVVVVFLAMYLLRDKKGGKRTKRRVVEFNPGRFINKKR